MPDEIERELTAFGRTLEERTGEAIRPGFEGRTPARHRPTRRWWALGGAAACLVAVVVGLLVATRPPEDDPVVSPGTSMPTTTTAVPRSPVDLVPEDPLTLVRDGWRRERVVDVLLGPDAVDADCAATTEPLSVLTAVHEVVVPPDGPEVTADLAFFVPGSPEREIVALDTIEMVARCIGEQRGLDVETTSLSSIRATWYRIGPDRAIGSVVGDGELAVVLDLAGSEFTDDLVAELAHRADQFLRGEEIVGAPIDNLVPTTTIVAQEGPFVERGPAVGEPQIAPQPGEVQLWVSNQSLADDPVTMIVRVDGIPVVSEVFFVEGQHNWQSWLIRGLAAGEHTVTAESDTGGTATWTFTLPDDEARWLVVDYWYEPDGPDGRRFTFDESDQPITFA